MKTWRERIAEARARGSFTSQDRIDAFPHTTCAIGEVAAHYGISIPTFCAWEALNGYQGTEFLKAVHRNKFDAAERALDRIEDGGLEIKRGAVNDAPASDARSAEAT